MKVGGISGRIPPGDIEGWSLGYTQGLQGSFLQSLALAETD